MIVYGEKGIGRPRSDSQLVETSWRDGQLVFREQRLSDVVADIGRYRSGRIVIWDDALTQLRVDGVFDMRNPDAALAAIVATLPVRMLQLSPYMTVLRQA
jgi:transmembrane sensor